MIDGIKHGGDLKNLEGGKVLKKWVPKTQDNNMEEKINHELGKKCLAGDLENSKMLEVENKDTNDGKMDSLYPKEVLENANKDDVLLNKETLIVIQEESEEQVLGTDLIQDNLQDEVSMFDKVERLEDIIVLEPLQEGNSVLGGGL